MVIRNKPSRWLEQHRSSLFVLGGVLLVGYASLNTLAAATGTEYEALENVLGPGGFALGFLGLLGYSPAIDEGHSLLTRIGAACAALGTSGFSIITIANVGRLAGLVATEPPAWFPILLVMVALGMLVGYGSLAFATLRGNAHSRLLGYLLFAPAVIFATMATQAILFAEFGLFTPEYMYWGAVVVSSGQALAHLAIGRTLRHASHASVHEFTARDATAS